MALCGILIVNITAMGDSWYQSFPRELQSILNPDWIVWIITQIGFSDTMRALFSMLFGAGIILMCSRGMSNGIYLKRNIFLVVLGLLHGTVLLWGYEILFVYGVSALLLFPLRKAASGKLFRWAGCLLLVFCGFSLIGSFSSVQVYDQAQTAISAKSQGQILSSEQANEIKTWVEAKNKKQQTSEAWEKELRTRQSGYLANLRLSTQQFFQFQFGSSESVFIIFETVATILLGMALFASGIISGQRSERFYWKLMWFGYGIGLPIRALTVYGIWDSGIVAPVWYDLAFYEPARIATTLGHLGLFFLLFHKHRSAAIWQYLGKMGQMALTSYIGQSVIAAFLFYGFGFNLFGSFGWLELTSIAVAILIGQCLFSYYWLSRFRFGPLEWAWRSLTYGKLQPMQKPGEASIGRAS